MKSNFYLSFLFFIFYCLNTNLSFSQYRDDWEIQLDVVLYSTYEDYTNGKGKKVGELYEYNIMKTLGIPTIKLKVKNGGSKQKIDVKEEWGFSVGENVFRIIKGAPYKLVLKGDKIAYFENGSTHLTAIIFDEEILNFSSAEIRFLFGTGENNETYTLNQFKQKFKNETEYKEVCECLSEYKGLMKSSEFSKFHNSIVKCVKNFIKSEK